MLEYDLMALAEFAAIFVVLASIVDAWRNPHLRPRVRRCPQCRGHLSRFCRTCDGSGRIPHPRKRA